MARTGLILAESAPKKGPRWPWRGPEVARHGPSRVHWDIFKLALCDVFKSLIGLFVFASALWDALKSLIGMSVKPYKVVCH